MKRNIFAYLLLIAFSMIGLTSCLDDVGNKQSLQRIMSTVVSTTMTRKMVQWDANGCYYYADELLAGTAAAGDRILLDELVVNYDEQENGANGTLDHPYKMTEVKYTKVDLQDFIFAANDQNLTKDTVQALYAPYINISSLHGGTYYMTFSGAVLDNADPAFRLVDLGVSKDTICYELRAEFRGNGKVGNYDGFVQCFRLPSLVSAQPVKVTYLSKKSDVSSSYYKNATTYVIYAPTTTEQ